METNIYSLPKIVGREQRVTQREKRNGVEIEKGAKLFPSKLDKNLDFFKKYWEHFTNYPDLFIDLIIPSYSHFTLYFYQRIK